MKAKELLLECKIKLNKSSDYALAKELDIDRARIADFMSGKRTPDSYAAVKIALCLGRDPAEIIAEIEADTVKNPQRKAFWVDFLQRVRKAPKAFTLVAIFTISLLGGVAETASGFRRKLDYA